MNSICCRHVSARSGTMATWAITNEKQRVNEILQQMDIPQHPEQLLISSAIRMIEKYGNDGLFCSRCKKAKLELLYVVRYKRQKRSATRIESCRRE
ncbi:MAG: hypothetical protein WKG06_37000 [Segetibacter sp.]